MDGLKELYNYREMLSNLVKKDLRTRYKGSVLGFLWTFVNPLLQLIIYTIAFSTIMRVNVDKFYMYLFIALIPWLFFATSLQTSASCIISNKDLIKKIYFPRLVIPISVVNSAFMNMVFSMVIVFLALIFSGIGIDKNVIFLPIIMILEYLFVLGLSFIFAAINVYFRDLEHILGIITMGWFYITPIVYTIDMIPEKYLGLFYLNPMTRIVTAYRDVLYYKQIPDFASLAIILVWSIVFIILGYILFGKLQKNFVEEL
ncbi:ABC transporter permease [Clostridium chromiireducens]|uniref:Transport permease protein n=1 Tax=Clostridium chromiireducens TaxID=225345 RepID=A0A964RJI0_9CLOT|nr:ABC transporter permease [Clostridium chromiireducens]MVX62878.1 ABC transporter permease [Clostridium chromiireducens]